MDKRYQVFVSSTYRDLLEHRQTVIKALMQVNAIPVGMELFPAADDDAWALIKRAIDESDYYLVIIGGRYGSVAADGFSYTEKEYDYAVKQGKPVMAFLHSEPGKLERDKTETDNVAWEKLQAFRKKAEGKHCKYWKDMLELTNGVLTSYLHITTQKPGLGWVRGDKAKTLEDVEQRNRLQQEVAALKAEIEKLRSVDDGTSGFAQGDERVVLQVACRADGQIVGRTVSVTWSDVLAGVAEIILSQGEITDVAYDLALLLLRTCEAIPDSAKLVDRVGMDVGDFAIVRNQLLALKMIDIDVRGPGVRWRLTEKGRDAFARARAIKRSRPNATASAPGAAQINADSRG